MGSRPRGICEASRAHVTPNQLQVDEGMECWVCGHTFPLESYEHRLYGLSYMMPEHGVDGINEDDERPVRASMVIPEPNPRELESTAVSDE